MDSLVINRNRNPVNAEVPASAERRRPGRLAFVSEQLIPLLRAKRQLSPDPVQHESDDPDQLRPARGLGLGVLCSVLLWAFLGATVWFVLTIAFQSA
jgi:hypothetical protein